MCIRNTIASRIYNISNLLMYSQHKRVACVFLMPCSRIWSAARATMLAWSYRFLSSHPRRYENNATRQNVKTAVSRFFLPGRTIVRRAVGKRWVFHLLDRRALRDRFLHDRRHSPPAGRPARHLARGRIAGETTEHKKNKVQSVSLTPVLTGFCAIRAFQTGGPTG